MIDPNFYRSLSDREVAEQVGKIRVWKVILYVGLLGLLAAAQMVITKLKYGTF